MTAIQKPAAYLRTTAVLAALLVAGVTIDALVNGVDDFEHPAVAAIMIYEPDHPIAPGWRVTCGGALIHKRVIQTAGHCIQFSRARQQAGIVKAVWVSFQQDPLAHFSADPELQDPASGGWYEIASLHNNPDNVDFLSLMQASQEEVLSVWGTFHDSGAIILKHQVQGIKPMKMESTAGAVARRLAKADCEDMSPDCKLLVVAYGLRGFPVVSPVIQARQSALLRYQAIDPLFISTFAEPPGSAFGTVCPADSGSPVVLLGQHESDKTIVAINSSPVHPFAPPCSTGALLYRVDTESHVKFIREVIIQSLYRGPVGQ